MCTVYIQDTKVVVVVMVGMRWNFIHLNVYMIIAYGEQNRVH